MKKTLRKILHEERDYIRLIRGYAVLAMAVFLLAVGGGFLYAHSYPTETTAYLQEMQSYFGGITKETPWGTFLSIFSNNVDAMFMVVAMGFFAGLFSFFFLAVNGFLLGIVGSLFVSQASVLVFLAGIVPHGIIEIPCMLLSAAIGLRVGASAVRRLLGRPASPVAELAAGLRFMARIIVPALLLAALIETYVTPIFISLAQLATPAG